MNAVAMATGDVTPELVMELLGPSEVALSADGLRIAFGVSATFREQGKLIETRLWTGEVDGELRPGEAGTLPRFSPDGSRLAFASDRGHQGRKSLWVDDRELGEVAGSVEDMLVPPQPTSSAARTTVTIELLIGRVPIAPFRNRPPR
jgi:dipeptidyl aminopeptidase/acylaminoacyl peptidase